MKLFIFLKTSLLFNIFYSLFCLDISSLPLNNLKTKKAMNAKLSGFVSYVKAIIDLLLYKLQDSISKSENHQHFTRKKI